MATLQTPKITASTERWAARWQRPGPLQPSEWAERHRHLSSDVAAEPGPWRNKRTPYLVGIMDSITEPGVEQVVLLKGAQVGFSEATRNLLGYWIDHDPGPAMIVMPDQKSAEEIVEERIRPMLMHTPRLRQHVSGERGDNKVSATRFDTMTLYIGWAGSPQALASRPIRYVVFDEVDNYSSFSGKEADPISLGLKRLTTYGDRARAIIGSTPTTRTNFIWQWWEACTDQRRFYVPCPYCDHRQALSWDGVKYPAAHEGETQQARAERIEAEDLARYQCASCEALWTEAQKNQAVRRGEWRSELETASPRRVGFHLSSLYSPWVTLSKLAGEWLRAQDDPALLMDFRNNRLAAPFEERASATKPAAIEHKQEMAGPALVVPPWGAILIATADVQKDHLFYVVRAWGHGYKSQLVTYGIATDFEAVLDNTLRRQYPKHDTGEAVDVALLAIDSKFRTDEVLEFAQRDPARIWPMAGSGRLNHPPITERKVKGYTGVIRRDVNPNYWKDILHGRIHDDDPTLWLPHNAIDDAYIAQMASEHKILDPKQRAWVWVKLSSGVANHYFDCESMQCAAAQIAGVAALPSPEQRAQHRRQTSRDDDEPRIQGSWANKHKGRW